MNQQEIFETLKIELLNKLSLDNKVEKINENPFTKNPRRRQEYGCAFVVFGDLLCRGSARKRSAGIV